MLLKTLIKDRLALAGLFILGLIVLMTLCPIFFTYTYSEIHLELKNQPPSWQFWFGTDDLGRDIFTRVCYGARISLFVGIAAAVIDLFLGILWGGMAGYAGGHVDLILMRIADVLYAIPSLLIVVLLTVILEPGLFTIIAAMAILGWITMARIVRGQIIKLKESEFVLAAHGLGASPSRIFFKHLIPNSWGPIIITLTYSIPAAIFTEAFLSYLGLGVQAPIASWGTMASEGLSALQYYPWRIFFPALFIMLTLFSFNVIGDGLKKILMKDD